MWSRDFFGFLRSSSVSSWLIHCSSSVSFFSDSLWLWFGVKKLSNFRTRFRCDTLTIARRVHHAWLSMRRTCSVERDWNFPCSVLACNFCTEINLFVCASFPAFFSKFWRGQIVPLAVFLRDNFNCSEGLAQRRGLAQTLQMNWLRQVIRLHLAAETAWVLLAN